MIAARRLMGWFGLPLVLLLSGCPQGAPEQPASQQSDSASPDTGATVDAAPETSPPTPIASDAPGDAKRPERRIRTGGPLPPQRMPEPVVLDLSCKTDADCTVKNVGNCCGAYPACVNTDSPADPKAVQAQCAREGKLLACRFRQIDACKCAKGSCLALIRAIEPSIDPVPQPPEER